MSELIRLDLNENRHGCSPRVAEALAELIRTPLLSRYPDAGGSPLRERLAELHGVDPGQVVLYNGSAEALFWMVMAHHALPAVVPVPTYHGYATIVRHLGMSLSQPEIYLPELDLERLRASLPPDEGRLVVLAQPNNPTGRAIPRPELVQLIRDRAASVFLIDEAYADFGDDSLVGDLEGLPNCLLVKTFSKAHGLAGLRIGYALVPSGRAEVLRGCRIPYSVDQAAQAAALAAVGDRTWFRETVARIRTERDWLAARLGELGLKAIPGQGNFLLVDAGGRTGALAGALLGAGIQVKTWEDPVLAPYFRVTVGTRAEHELLLSAIANGPGRTTSALPVTEPTSPEAAVPDIVATLMEYVGRLEGSDRLLSDRLGSGLPEEARQACAEVLSSPGKRIRSALALMVADEVEPGGGDAAPVAAAITLLHNAMITFDDVITANAVRRGQPSVYARLGPRTGTLVGVTLHALAHDLIWRGNLPAPTRARLAEAFARHCTEAAAGVTAYLVHEERLRACLPAARRDRDPARVLAALDPDVYLDNVRSRTGTIFAAALELGAIAGGAGPDRAAAYGQAGLHFGSGFQLLDDVVDFLPLASSRAGKRAGREMSEGRLTPVLRHALLNSSRPELILAVLGNEEATAAELEAATGEVCGTGALGVTVALAAECMEEGKAWLHRASLGGRSLLDGLSLELVMGYYGISPQDLEAAAPAVEERVGMTTDDELENLREQVVAALRCHLEGAPDGGLERLLEAQVGEIREPQLLRLLAGIGQEGGWSVRSLYDSLADVYEQAFPDRAHIGESLDLLPEGFRCETAVDLGCGTGLSTLGLLPLAHQVVALDISAEMLRIARERLAGAAVTFLEADFTRRIPLPDRSTDLVYSVGALRHVPVGSEAAVLAECARILRPGGLALLTLVTPAPGPAQVLDQALARYMSAHGITDRRFLEEEILEDCRAAGLDVMETWSEPSRYLYGKLFLLARRATGSPESRTARIG